MSKTKKDAVGLATNDIRQSASQITNDRISDFDAAVKQNDLDGALCAVGMATKDAAELLVKRFPKLDKSIVSKCRKPELYGCRLHEDGYTLIRFSVFGEGEAVATPQENEEPSWACKHTSERHRFKRRLQCRLPDDKYEQFKQQIYKDGFATVNDALLTLVLAYIEKGGVKHVLS